MEFKVVVDKATNKTKYVSVNARDIHGKPIKLVFDELPQIVDCEYTVTYIDDVSDSVYKEESE